MKIVLTGFMGAGKSTVGPILAAALDLPFVDLDAAIEAQAGKPVTEIFRGGGEAEFRRLERRALRATLAGEDAVVAVGGGALTGAAAWDLLGEGDVTVWLDPGLELSLDRATSSDEPERPLLADRATMGGLLARRQAWYARADIRVEINADESPFEVAARVRAALEEAGCATW